MRNYKFVFVIFVLIISIIACEKDVVNDAPHLTINAPTENISLKSIDTVWVDCNVTDDNATSLTVTIYIVNMQMQSVSQAMVLNYQGAHAHVLVDYDFSNRWMPSGQYYLVVQASDGSLISKAYVHVNISSIPKQFSGLVVGVQNQQGCDVYVSDTTFVFNKKLSFPATLKGCFNPYGQDIEILLSSGVLKSYGIDYYDELYSKSGLNKIGSPYNGDLMVKYPYTYVSDANGNIFALDVNGNVRNSISTLFSPYKLLFWNNEWEVLCSLYPQSYNWIEVPILNKNYQTSYTLSDLLPLDDSHCLVISQQNQSVQMMTYKPEINYLTNFGQVIIGQYNGGIMINEQLYVSVGNDLFLVDKTYGSVFIAFQGVPLMNLKWDDVNQQLYASYQNNLCKLSFPQVSIQNTFAFTGNVIFYDFIYK
jgi:hypothetical protein